MMPKFVVLVLAALLLGGCQQAPVQYEASSHSRIATGSTLSLTKPMTVPAGHARVFLQGGKVREKVRLKRYQPHCEFEVDAVSDGTLRIEPDDFFVIDRFEYEVEIVRLDAPVRVAGKLLLADADSIPMLNSMVRYSLHSEHQPHVRYLTCYDGFSDPWAMEYPSLDDTREALGEWVTWKEA